MFGEIFAFVKLVALLLVAWAIMKLYLLAVGMSFWAFLLSLFGF